MKDHARIPDDKLDAGIIQRRVDYPKKITMMRGDNPAPVVLARAFAGERAIARRGDAAPAPLVVEGLE